MVKLLGLFMEVQKMETNKITLAGYLEKLTFSHNTMSEDFYEGYISVQRESGASDVLRLVVPSILAGRLKEGTECMVSGEVRTRNVRNEEKTKLDVYVFVKEVFDYPGYDINETEFYGYICKKPTFRYTPLRRQISEYLLAINRPFGKSDYVPCISWGRGAKRMEQLEVGTELFAKGRMQSRTYNKKISDTEYEERVTYELSTSFFQVLEDSEVCHESIFEGNC